MRRWWVLLLCATASAASATPDPAAVLQRVLASLRASLKVIPNYTCVETITRDFYTPVEPVRRSCEAVLAIKKRLGEMKMRHVSTDRLRLEVALTKTGEILSWVGESRFEDRSIDELIPDGPVGTGLFAGMLASVFDQDVKTFRFEKEVEVNGQYRLEYSFDVPQQQSHYKVKVANGWAITGYSGSFDVDPAREEITALRMETAIFPPSAITCQSRTQLEFTMTAIGAGVFPMAARARQHFVASEGSEAVNSTQFSQCREYRGESTIRFGDPAPDEAPSRRTAAVRPDRIPAAVDMAIELTAPIAAATAAAGDRFTARLVQPMRAGRKTIARKGSRVEGRIVRVQIFHDSKPSAVFVLRPEVVETSGVRVPLAATRDLRREVDAARRKHVRILLPFPHEKHSGLFEITGEEAVLPKGTYSEWRTDER